MFNDPITIKRKEGNMSDYKYKTVYPNYEADIDEGQFEQEGAIRLENMCPSCGSITLYAYKSPIGYWIACASKGCDGGFDTLWKSAMNHRNAYYKERMEKVNLLTESLEG